MSSFPFDLRIPDPCNQPWSSMTGNATQRHCTSCKKQVHNLAGLTSGQIERLVREADGPLCARITRRADGSLVAARDSRPATNRMAASLLFGAALSPTSAFAQQSSNPAASAVVTGSVVLPNGAVPTTLTQILFLQKDKLVLNTTADPQGRWTAQLPPGMYDVVFRQNALFGKRVKAVELHAGVQSFSTVRESLAPGDLYLPDETYTTMGAMVMTTSFRLTLVYRMKHPIRYLSYLRQRHL